MFLLDFDSDCAILACILAVLYRVVWFDAGRGTFH